MRILSHSFAPKCALVLGLLPLVAGAFAQTLPLDEALRMAKAKNGAVRASLFNIKGAQSRVIESLAAYYPTITPFAQYNSDRKQVTTISGTAFVQNEGLHTGGTSSWRLLDSGEREYSLLSSRRSEDATKQDALQTLRNTLFLVHQQYFDALRAEDLLRIASSQVERTNKILDQTETGVKVGSTPQKDILQARADALNAKVNELVARNQSATAQAALKATIGWDANTPLPKLEPKTEPTDFPKLEDLKTYIDRGLKMRADLTAQRRRIDAQRFLYKRADRQAGITFSLDATFDKDFSPDALQSRTLTAFASMPLFDGGLSRAAANDIKFSLMASEALLEQSERQAASDIESAFTTLTADGERLQAAKLALDAAQLNYKAAVDSQAAGASDLIQVLTAQVSLVTAESNYTQAMYDYYTADVQLKLVTGVPLPGEAAT